MIFCLSFERKDSQTRTRTHTACRLAGATIPLQFITYFRSLLHLFFGPLFFLFFLAYPIPSTCSATLSAFLQLRFFCWPLKIVVKPAAGLFALLSPVRKVRKRKWDGKFIPICVLPVCARENTHLFVFAIYLCTHGIFTTIFRFDAYSIRYTCIIHIPLVRSQMALSVNARAPTRSRSLTLAHIYMRWLAFRSLRWFRVTQLKVAVILTHLAWQFLLRAFTAVFFYWKVLLDIDAVIDFIISNLRMYIKIIYTMNVFSVIIYGQWQFNSMRQRAAIEDSILSLSQFVAGCLSFCWSSFMSWICDLNSLHSAQLCEMKQCWLHTNWNIICIASYEKQCNVWYVCIIRMRLLLNINAIHLFLIG